MTDHLTQPGMDRTRRAFGRPAEGLIALLTLLFAVFLAGPWLINAPPVDPGHPFDTEATVLRLARILGDEAPHPVDSDAGDAVIDRLSAEIRSLGFSPTVDDGFHCTNLWGVSCARVRNVGFWVTEPGPDAVMVASHHDSVPTGPGAADDGMGVAASLEIARLMKARIDADGGLPRPLYILITDGEEIGLVGAARFVDTDPVAALITAVVSLEARGNRGPAAMFETSAPNGRDIAALKPSPVRRARGPVANSLSVDIYRAMPNGTDVTEYLRLDMDAANYAMTGHESHYHTRFDDMAHLNRASVFHVGASALSAVEGFMTVDADTPDTDRIYADVLGLGVVNLPRSWALPLIVLTLLAGLAAAVRRRDGDAPLWRALLLPVAALLAGTGAAVLGGMIVAAIRPESAFGTAYPAAYRGLVLALSLGAAALAARALYRPAGADRFLAGAWAVMMALGVAATLAFPGASVLFALPALLVLPAALLLAFGYGRVARWVFGAAAVLLTTQGLSLYVMAETALFVETSAPLTALVVWVFCVSLPLVWTRPGQARRALIGAGLAVALFAGLALFVPAYSPDAPEGRNYVHLEGDGVDRPVWLVSGGDPIPESVRVIGFERRSVGDVVRDSWVADAPPSSLPAPRLSVVSDEIAMGARMMTLEIEAPEADSLLIGSAAPRAELASLVVGGFPVAVDGPMPRVECTGRSCRTLTLQLTLRDADAPVELVLRSIGHGLEMGMGPDADALLAARPDWSTPQHDGDRRIRRVALSLPPAASVPE